MEFERNSSDVTDVKWPTTTTGTRDPKSWGGLPALATWTTSDRVEVVERAAQSLDEQEDEGDGQEGEDGQEPPAHAPTAARGWRRRALVNLRRRRGGVGGDAAHD